MWKEFWEEFQEFLTLEALLPERAGEGDAGVHCSSWAADWTLWFGRAAPPVLAGVSFLA